MIRDLFVPFMVLAFGVFILTGTLLSHDISWYLISTRWWLEGVPIYEEILELNPPLAFYLTAIPVWISGVLGLTAMAAFKGFVFALIAVSLLMSAMLLHGDKTISDQFRRIIVGAAAIGLILLPIGDFGQRDHLFAIQFLPFLILSLLATRPSRACRAGVAAWAVLGVALKHYFVLLPLLILVCEVVRARSLRPVLRIEFVLPAVLLLAYVAASFVLHPAYFDDVIPLTLQVYGAFDASFTQVLSRAGYLIAVLAVALAFAMMDRSRPHANGLMVVTGATAISVFLIQSKGWNYQLIPAGFFVLMAVTWTAFSLSQARNQWWPAMLAALAIFLLVGPALLGGAYQNTFAKKVEPYFTCAPGERSFQIFSSTVSTGFPLANYAQAEPANRAPTLWLFPGPAYRLSQTDDLKESARYRAVLRDARARVLEDFFRVRPQVVIVDVSPRKVYFNGAPFDYLDYFREDHAFSKAWEQYQLQGKVDTYEIYAREGCQASD